MAAVTAESAAESAQAWGNSDIEAFNESDTIWNLTGNLNGTGGAPNTVSEVLSWLGNEIGQNSYALVTLLQSAGIKLGAALDHDPCK